jgi:hypothetical protein
MNRTRLLIVAALGALTAVAVWLAGDVLHRRLNLDVCTKK